MNNFERIKQMSKEELAQELKLLANWDKKQKRIAEQDEDFYIKWLDATVNTNNESDNYMIKDITVIMCSDSACDKYGHEICCKYCSALGNCIKEGCECSEVNEDIRECAYAKL